MSERLLVTGAAGLVGSAVVRHLVDDGRAVVATDVDTPANRRRLREFPGVDVRWGDLTDAAVVDSLMASATPAAVIHLAAVIPPSCYARPALARAVNVDATAELLRAAATLPARPRFVYASSIAVYGTRNPHQIRDLLTADTDIRPSDIYGRHKAEAENLVRNCGLDWVVLRLGGVVSPDLSLNIDKDVLYFESLLPSDGRIQTVDVRDAARAFVAATTADVVGRTLLIGGDPSHRLRQGELVPAMLRAMGLGDVRPAGRPGDPSDPKAWFATDWMDSEPAQEILGFQKHSWPDTLHAITTRFARHPYAMRLITAIARPFLRRHSAYHRTPGRFADPWGRIRARWGDPGPA